ncbi:MAG: hypothetical protein AAF702_01540 [Chloroflexota bacterium]
MSSVVSTIRQAFAKSPLLAAVTTFLCGAAFGLAPIGIMVPALLITVTEILFVIMLILGCLYMYVTQRARQRANPFALPRWVIGVQITINMNQHHPRTHRMAWAM